MAPDFVILGNVHGDHTGDPGRDDWFTAWTKANAWFLYLAGLSGGLAGYLSDTITAATTDDYNPGGGFLSGIGFLDIAATGSAESVIYGMVAGTDKQKIQLRGTGTQDVVFAVEGTSSAVANRFYAAGDSVMSPGQVKFATYYSLPNPRWTIS